MSTPESEELRRVSTLELFFDLVFVFTITQLTTVLVPRAFDDALGGGDRRRVGQAHT